MSNDTSSNGFALYQLHEGTENHQLRFLSYSYLQKEATAFRAKVHEAVETLVNTLFYTKQEVEEWLRNEGFVIRPNEDVEEITVSDDMQHESTIYLKYGTYCVEVDSCDTRALDRLVDAERYNMAYTGSLPAECAEMTERAAILESIFYQMNMRRPEAYRGASMSVSDVVALTLDGQTSYYYTDNYGFRELTDFHPVENSLRNAEIALEDDYDMLDGIVNNGSKHENDERRESLHSQLKACAEKPEHPDKPSKVRSQKEHER